MTRQDFLPIKWYVGVVTCIVVGIALIRVGIDVPSLAAIQPQGINFDWGKVLGVYLAGVPIVHLVVFFSLAVTTNLFGLDRSIHKESHLWPPALIGILEGVMYPTSLMIGQAEFIGVWLALKVAGQWGRWSVAEQDQDKIHEGRRRYYQSLIGNALSVLGGVAIYLGIKVLGAK